MSRKMNWERVRAQEQGTKAAAVEQATKLAKQLHQRQPTIEKNARKARWETECDRCGCTIKAGTTVYIARREKFGKDRWLTRCLTCGGWPEKS